MLTTRENTRQAGQIRITTRLINGNGPFLNNNHLPLLIYHDALIETDDHVVKELLRKNNWTGSWVDGIYNYHHFHSTAHEVLGILKGSAEVQFGGPNGISIPIHQGDVVVIPAGVSHKCITSEREFRVIGAYPKGQRYDIMKGHPDELEEACDNISKVPLPVMDPVYGEEGPLVKLWFRQPGKDYLAE